MIELIRRSLSRDFRDLTRHHLRSHVRDCILQAFSHASLEEIALEAKSLNRQLASDSNAYSRVTLFGLQVPIDCPSTIRAIRQLVGFFSRLSSVVTDDTKTKQLEELKDRWTNDPPHSLRDEDIENARYFVRRILGREPSPIRDWHFRHGPGAVSTGEKGLEKIHFSTSYLSVDEYCGFNSDELLRMPHAPFRCLRREEPVTRVLLVPKDALKMRPISCEPLTMQFFQQGLMDQMFSRMVRRMGWHFPLVDQAPSRSLAWEGSCAHLWGRPWRPCTIDLSSASDDVRVWHIRTLFPDEWVRALMAFRSTAAKFPDDTKVELSTFAPMGAATCFPTETLVFAALRYAAWRRSRPTPRVHDSWAQFGDDCITSAWNYESTLEIFRDWGFSPNVSKCCGPAVLFRESCGGDFLEGEDVSVVRPRTLPRFGTIAAIPPTVEMIAGLLARGFRETSQTLASTIAGPVPLGSRPDWKLFTGINIPAGRIRYNRNLQRWEQQGLVLQPARATPLGDADGWEALFTSFTSGWKSETYFPQSGRRPRLKKTWLPLQEGYDRRL